MTIRAATYAFGRPIPYLLQRGATQTIDCPVRHGAGGALVVPTGGTYSVLRPGGTPLVSAAPVVVSSSIATGTVTPSAAEALGAGWTVELSLVIGGNAYPVRIEAFLCDWVPLCPVSEADLYLRLPELRHRVPQSQGERGTGEGWQPQIDAAWYELVRRLLSDGARPWTIRGVHGSYDWVLTRALQLCIDAISVGLDESLAERKRQLHFDMQRAAAGLRFQFDEDTAALRRGQGPVTRLAPVGRPTW
ncbi:MAG: hypothetical protein EBX36_02085 [Planctomycetia bacterium]|nr:hypothetical protein [Planctomycetia bacterium]